MTKTVKPETMNTNHKGEIDMTTSAANHLSNAAPATLDGILVELIACIEAENWGRADQLGRQLMMMLEDSTIGISVRNAVKLRPALELAAQRATRALPKDQWAWRLYSLAAKDVRDGNFAFDVSCAISSAGKVKMDVSEEAISDFYALISAAENAGALLKGEMHPTYVHWDDPNPFAVLGEYAGRAAEWMWVFEECGDVRVVGSDICPAHQALSTLRRFFSNIDETVDYADALRALSTLQSELEQDEDEEDEEEPG